jgi:hypothetical protein
MRHLLAALAMLCGLAACVSTSGRWEKPGVSDATADEAACREQGRQQAADALPYGSGPPLYGFTSEISMLQWTMAIDNERSRLAAALAYGCMQDRGFVLVPV